MSESENKKSKRELKREAKKAEKAKKEAKRYEARMISLARTAVVLLAIVCLQFITRHTGHYVIGTVVNAALVLMALKEGLYSGIVVGAFSPLFAYFLSAGVDYLQTVPFIAAANLLFVLAWKLIAGRKNIAATGKKFYYTYSAAAIVSAVIKFVAVFLGVKVVIGSGMISGLSDAEAASLEKAFSYPELITAFLGGIIAFLAVIIINSLSKLKKTK